MFHVREPVKAEVLQLCSHAKACVSVSLVEERCGTKCAQGNKSLQSKRVFFFYSWAIKQTRRQRVDGLQMTQ